MSASYTADKHKGSSHYILKVKSQKMTLQCSKKSEKIHKNKTHRSITPQKQFVDTLHSF